MDGNVESHIQSQTILHWFCETEKIIFKFLNNTEKLGTIAPSGKSFKSYFAWWSMSKTPDCNFDYEKENNCNWINIY